LRAHAHRQLEQTLAANPNLKAHIIFTATNHPEDKRGQIVRLFLSLNRSLYKEALTTWYGQPIKNYDTWARQYPTEANSEEAKTQLDLHNSWCMAAKIEATPTFFINGFALPHPYSLADAGRLLAYSTLSMDLAESK
jgi:hypothetical protein